MAFFLPKVGFRFLVSGFLSCLAWDWLPWVGEEQCYFCGEKPAHHLRSWDEAAERSGGALKVTASEVPQDHPDGGRAEQTIAIAQRGRGRPWWSFAPIAVEPLGKSAALDTVSLEWGPGSASLVTLRAGSPPLARAVMTIQADGIWGRAWLMLGSQEAFVQRRKSRKRRQVS